MGPSHLALACISPSEAFPVRIKSRNSRRAAFKLVLDRLALIPAIFHYGFDLGFLVIGQGHLGSWPVAI